MGLQVDVGTTGNDAQIVLPAVSNTYYVIQRITYSYSANITIGAGNLLTKFGTDSVLDVDLKESQGDFIYGMQSDPNESVTMTLKGVALVKGKISVDYLTFTV